MQTRISFTLLFLFSWALAFSSSSDVGGKDTARAMVVYNLENIDLELEHHSESFNHLIDSVKHLDHIDEDMSHLIGVVASIHKKTEEELILLIDSLFTLDKIPYALINEINFRIAEEEFMTDVDDGIFRIEDDGSGIPSNSIYSGSWVSTKSNPYSRSLSASDSTMTIILTEVNGNRSNYYHPVDNIVTSRFGWRDGRNHNGYDIDLQVWDPVHSAFAGKVRFAGWGGGYGRLVIVRHHNGLETFYAHLHRLKVEVGEEVVPGQVLGLGGSSGHSTGSHLHFEMRFKGIPLDPGQIINFRTQDLHNDTIVLKKTRWSYAVHPHGIDYHVVEKGDYLHRIANQYGLSVQSICDLNGIRRNDYLRLGQKLRIGTQ